MLSTAVVASEGGAYLVHAFNPLDQCLKLLLKVLIHFRPGVLLACKHMSSHCDQQEWRAKTQTRLRWRQGKTKRASKGAKQSAQHDHLDLDEEIR
jgi:hypothetical protein